MNTFNFKYTNKRRAMSLLALVITIVTMLILSTAAILIVMNNNSIDNAREASIKTDIAAIMEDYKNYDYNTLLSNATTSEGFNKSFLTADSTSVVYNGQVIENKTIADILPSIKGTKYESLIHIVNGIIYIDAEGYSDKEIAWINDEGMATSEGQDDIKLSLNETSIKVMKGQTRTLTAVIIPSSSNEEVEWSSDDSSIASVDTQGKIQALSQGNATITAKIKNKDITATCNVEVIEVEYAITDITLNKDTIVLSKDDTETLVATIIPSNATDKSLVWSSSNNSVATVDSQGKVTARSGGETTITVKNEASTKQAICKVIVSQAATALNLDKYDITLGINQTEKITANITPNDATNRTVTFTSSDESIVTVDNDGNIKGLKEGSAYITVTSVQDSNLSKVCTVNVEVQPESIEINKTEGRLTVGNTDQLNVNVLPENATNKEVTWSSSDTSIATVGIDGLVTAEKAGTVTITATTKVANKQASCTYTIVDTIDSISLDITRIGLRKNRGQQLTATLHPSETKNTDVVWESSNPEAVTVDQNGYVKGINIGDATITVTSKYNSSITASCYVYVTTPLSISASISNITGNTADVRISSYTTDGTVSSVVLNYQKDGDEAYMNYTEYNPGVYNDTRTITMEGLETNTKYNLQIVVTTTNNDTYTLKTSFTTSFVNITAISLNKISTTMSKGQTEMLQATLTPSNATNDIVWSSSNSSVVSVDSTGKLTANAIGSAVVTAMSNSNNSVKATCTVNVISPISVSVSKVSTTLNSINVKINSVTTVGKLSYIYVYYKKSSDSSYTLYTTITPNSENYTNDSLAITGLTENTDYNIRVVANNNKSSSATADTTIKTAKTDVTSITLNQTSLSLDIGQTATLTATVNPSNASVKGYVFESGDTSIATVDQNGVVTAIKEGTAVITAVSDDNPNIKGVCTVNVKYPLTLTSYVNSYSQNSITVYINAVTKSGNINSIKVYSKKTTESSYSLKTTLTPSNTSYAANYTISGLTQDSAYDIRVEATTTTGYTKTVDYEASTNKILVTSVSLNKTSLNLDVGASEKLTATINPTTATERGVIWSSSNPAVATVSQDGTVTTLTKGTATITAKSKDDNSKYATCNVVTNAVARIGDNYYQTLQAAFDALSEATYNDDGGYYNWTEVYLLEDITETNPTLASGRYVDLYMNNKTISGGLTNNGNLNIWDNGTITSNSGSAITNNGGLDLEGAVYVEALDGNTAAIINNNTIWICNSYCDVVGYRGIENYGSNVYLYGGNITSTSDDCISMYNGTLDIYNANLNGRYGIWTYDEGNSITLNLNDVYISTAMESLYVSSNAHCNFNSGNLYSDFLISAIAQSNQGSMSVPSGKYILNVSENNQTKTYLGTTAVAKTSLGSFDTYYETLQNAFDLSNGNTIYLIKSYTLSTQTSLVSDKSATLDFNGYTLTSSVSNYALVNNGSLTLTGSGNLTSTTNGLVKNQAGTLNISTVTLNHNNTSNYGIYTTGGTTNINSGTINSNGNAIRINAGTVNVKGGTVNGGKTNSNWSAVYVESSSGTLVVGTSGGGIPSISNPVIKSTYYYGVNNSGGTFKFYDGAISGKTNAISGTITEIESGYSKLSSTTNGIETITLGNDPVASIDSTQYDSLQAAFNAVTATSTSARQTITLLKDITLTSTATFPQNKYATLNMAGKTITSSMSSSTISNSGNLIISGNASTTTTSTTNLIQNSAGTPIYNSSTGTLTLSNVRVNCSTSSYLCINNQSGSVTVNSGATVTGANDAVNSTNGTVTINGGTLNSSNNSGVAMTNGTLYVYSGSNVSGPYGLYLMGSNTTYAYGGNIIGTSYKGIYLESTSSVNVSGAYVKGNTDGIQSSSSSTTINVSSGTVEAVNNTGVASDGIIKITGGSVTGIYMVSTTTLTIGNNADSVNPNSPTITYKRDGNDAVAGSGGTFNFYDGQLISRASNSSTVNQAITRGGSVNTPSGYETISKGTTGTAQTVTLYQYTKNITTEAQLRTLSTAVNAGYTLYGMWVNLQNDIDMSSTAFTPIGQSGSGFYGTFYGGSRTINNLVISTTSQYAGLFGKNYGSLQQFSLKNASISGNYDVGGIAGTNYSTGDIFYCNVYNSNITASSSNLGGIVGTNYGLVECLGLINSTVSNDNYYVGGIVGINASTGTVEYCANKGLIVRGRDTVGGIVGRMDGGTVRYVFNRAAVQISNWSVGGIIGWINTSSYTVTNTYNAGKVIGSNNIGPIYGAASSSSGTTNSYYLSGTCTSTSNTFGTAKSESDFKNDSFLSLVGGTGAWWRADIAEEGYPLLIDTPNCNFEMFDYTTATDTSKFKLDGELQPQNYGVNSTTAHTMTKIDLSKISSTYSFKITVNANITSESGCDIGFATVNTTSSAPAYNTTAGRFMYISGTKSDADYSTTIAGGSVYFLHLGYRKDGSVHASNENFTINSVSITPEITSSTNTNAWDGSVNTSWYSSSSTSFNISTPQQLAGLAQLVNNGNTFEGKTINLTNNIDLNNREWTPIGTTNDHPFKGSFNGNYNSISNMKVTGSYNVSGLFGYSGNFSTYTSGSWYIKNLIVKDSTITGTSASVLGYHGFNTIENCASINNTITGSNNAGGVIVDGMGTTIKNCYNTSSVTCTYSSSTYSLISGGGYTGGIMAGCIDMCTVQNCYNSGTISAPNCIAGGLIGGFDCYDISSCYNVGTVTGKYAGELFGETNNGTVEYCFYLSGKTPISRNYTSDEDNILEIYSISAANLKLPSAVSNLGSAFKQDTYGINNGYPILSWQ